MITYRELLWLTHPEDVSDDASEMECPDNYEYEPFRECEIGESCDECWDREIPYPVVAEAMIESISVVNDYVVEKGTKLYVVKVDMETQTNWNVLLSEEPKNEEGVWFNKKDFRFYIDKEEKNETMKYEVGDKVKVREWTDDMLLPAKRFFKEDLKDGMMVETAAHEKFLFIGKAFRGTSCQISIDAYDSELNSCYYSKNDIIKVGYPDYEGCVGLTMLLQIDFGKVLWERHTKVITKKEAMAVLRKHYGENVVIAE